MFSKNSSGEKRGRKSAAPKLMKSDITRTSGRNNNTRKTNRTCPIKKITPSRLPPDGNDDSGMDPCDNSNDSGLGFDHSNQYVIVPSIDNIIDEAQDVDEPVLKKSKMMNKTESGFRGSIKHSNNNNLATRSKSEIFPSLSGPICATTRDGLVTLCITTQPEQQHRARYQTEGSRGAVKDRTGQGFPIIRLIGYNKAAKLQIFIGSDSEKVSPHMFYQACKVCGKNSTSCTEQLIDGTVVIELNFDPAKNMIVTCDCVGILKERNVDVEHRFPDESVPKNKKKSTRCRLVFRTCVERPNGTWETLQIVSQPIACTQLPGVPEIAKRSLTSCSVDGGAELFILGKNFLKDSVVVFQLQNSIHASASLWQEEVVPDKEYLQPNHLVCVVPPFHRQDLNEPVTVRLYVRSGGKCSEPHTFTYLPSSRNTVTGQNSVPVLPPIVEHTIINESAHNNVQSDNLALLLPTVTDGQDLSPAKISNTDPTLMPAVVMLNSTIAATPNVLGGIKTEKEINVTQEQLVEYIRQKLQETSANELPASTTTTSGICPSIENRVLQQLVNQPLHAQSGSSVETYLSKIEKINMNSNYDVSSTTAVDFPPAAPMITIPETITLESMMSPDSTTIQQQHHHHHLPVADTDPRMLNTQLDQLLTTDIVSNVDNSIPLVRDVLMGVPTIDETKLSQEISNLSDKDIFNYITNANCLDQVMQ